MTPTPLLHRCLRPTLALGALLAGLLAQAHSVWIEPTADGGLALRFAEPDGKFERSPGHLDELSAIGAFSVVTNGAPSALETARKRDQIRIARHRETLAGFHLGREHDLTSHNASLTWLQP